MTITKAIPQDLEHLPSWSWASKGGGKMFWFDEDDIEVGYEVATLEESGTPKIKGHVEKCWATSGDAIEEDAFYESNGDIDQDTDEVDGNDVQVDIFAGDVDDVDGTEDDEDGDGLLGTMYKILRTDIRGVESPPAVQIYGAPAARKLIGLCVLEAESSITDLHLLF